MAMNSIIETDRLLLRQLTQEDVSNLLLIFSDPEAMRYYPSTKNAEETARWIQWNQSSYDEHGFGLWAVERKDTQAFVGQCGLIMQRDVEGRDEVEVGYSFVRSDWSRGFATEAAIACRDYGFDSLTLPRLISIIDAENLASRRVAEKVGMQSEREISRWGKRLLLYSIAGSQARHGHCTGRAAGHNFG